MITLGRGSTFSHMGDQEFLAGHIEKWRERSARQRCSLRHFQIKDRFAPARLEPGRIYYGVFMHFMRSFIVNDCRYSPSPYIREEPAFKCEREHVSIQGFYGQAVIQLVERRYSVALGILPLVKPCGNFALTTVVDGDRLDSEKVWKYSPGHATLVVNSHIPWTRYGIYPAGLFNGVAMF